MGLGMLMICALFLFGGLGATEAEEQKLSSKECENLGFTGLALCSDCKSFSEYVKDQGSLCFSCLNSGNKQWCLVFRFRELVSDCLKCCTEDSDDSTSKVIYSGAVLEVCMRKLVFYPEIVGFIEEEKEKFPSVKVQYVFNSPPKLIMLDDDGQQKETIRVDNWKREHVLQFLREKLKPVSAV
ncbi:hypothetical protein LguiA_029033 [Lonicera macranthoides]